MSLNSKDDGSSSFSDDSDESSSSLSLQSATIQNNIDVLASFREKWQKELKITPTHDKKQPPPPPPPPQQTTINHVGNDDDLQDIEMKAKNLFSKGIEMEKSGKVYEAIQFYRRAVQLVPDIEFRLEKSKVSKDVQQLLPKDGDNRLQNCDDVDNHNDEDDADDDDDDDDDNDEIRDGELLPRIQKKLAKIPVICVPKLAQNTTHISILPMEMILYILKWVISSDLDLRSLEMFSMVCRGFYLCARDSELWRLACLRVWGLNCGSSPLNYLSWRHMFIERPRLQFNGCYISRTTYIRNGENSFQDQFYRPWHLVVYYRYLRFFPEGFCLVLTSADEPAQCVAQMKHRNARSPILCGYYRLKDDKVTLVVQRQPKNSNNNNTNNRNNRRTKRRGDNLYDADEQTFHMELEIRSTNKKRHVQLVWTHYSVFTRSRKGDENTYNFDLIGNRYPPLWFSRVKSYTTESEQPLE